MNRDAAARTFDDERKPFVEHDASLPKSDFLGSRLESYVPGSELIAQMRCMREEDLPYVLTIEHQSFPDPWSALAFVSEIRYNPQSRYMVACDGHGDVCGYFGLCRQLDQVWISRIAVDAQSRRKGIANDMVQLACALVDLSGFDNLALEVRSSNAGARAFYESMGFVQIDTWSGFYNNPPEDAVVMVKPLDA